MRPILKKGIFCPDRREAIVIDKGLAIKYYYSIYDAIFTTAAKGPEMNKKQLNEFKILLQNKKNLILKEATKTMNKELKIHKEEMADTIDRSAVETDQHFLLRLRDRERKLLKKINDSLKRIENGSFGICNLCGEEIGEKRLKARPMATLCIACKEEQEKTEKLYD